jgi:hypothetical protein
MYEDEFDSTAWEDDRPVIIPDWIKSLSREELQEIIAHEEAIQQIKNRHIPRRTLPKNIIAPNRLSSQYPA